MALCECGCGQESAREFQPGHDQKLRIALESRVGGVLAMRALVEATEAYAAGETPGHILTQVVRATFAK